MIAVIFFADNMASAFTPRAQSYFSARRKPILWITPIKAMTARSDPPTHTQYAP